MKKVLALAVLAATSIGCPAHWAELKKSEKAQQFVLDKDHVQSGVGGIQRTTWVAGLRAGTYTLQAEDEDGFYFRGQGACVIRLLDEEDALEYLKTGTVVKLRLNFAGQAGFLVGGVFLPRSGVMDDASLFYIAGETGVSTPYNAAGQPCRFAEVLDPAVAEAFPPPASA